MDLGEHKFPDFFFEKLFSFPFAPTLCRNGGKIAPSSLINGPGLILGTRSFDFPRLVCGGIFVEKGGRGGGI